MALAVSQHVRQSHQCAAERRRGMQPRREQREALAVSQHVRRSHKCAAERRRGTPPRPEQREGAAVNQSACEAKPTQPSAGEATAISLWAENKRASQPSE